MNFMLLDRFLIMMEKEEVPAVICFNKKDLAKQEELELLYETYKSCGYHVIFSSTFNGDGLDEIQGDSPGKDNSSCRSFRCGKILQLLMHCRKMYRWKQGK